MGGRFDRRSTRRPSNRARTSPASHATPSCSTAPTADIAPAPAAIDPDALRQRGALTRVVMMAGALDRMSRMTVGYTRQRRQFGRPIAQFQAVQQHLVHAAQDAALVTMAADVAVTAAERGPATFEIAAAKVLAGQAAAIGDARRPPGPRRDGHDPGVPAPTPQPTTVVLAPRVRRRHLRGAPGSAGQQPPAGADALYPSITAGSQLLSV